MSARSVSWLNLFLALSLLVSSLVPAPRLVRARDLPPAPSGAEEMPALPALDSPLPAPVSAALTDASPLTASLSAAPEAVAPGEVVTFTLKLLNTGDASLNGLSASAALPEGLGWIPGQADWTFDAREKRVSATPDALPPGAEQTFSLQLRAAGPLDEAATLNVEVTQGDATLAVAAASVWVAHPTQAQIEPQGGVLQASDGRVRITFPAGAVDQPAVASYAARMQRPARGPAAALRFELNLHSTDDTPLPLSAPVTLTLQVGDLLDLQVRPDAWPYLAYLDEVSGEWVRVPARADAQAGTLTAQVDHFSTWETGMDQQLNSGWRLTYNAPQVSTFSGAATFGYPIEVLSGRGGLQPALALSYNSRQVDGVLSWIQSDWAGLGWSIGGVEITRKVGREGSHNGYSNTFSLLMNGSSYKLIKDSNYPAAYGRYYTQPFSALRIERCNDLSTSSLCSDQPAPNTTGEYWIVRSPDGTTYKLGYTADAEQVVSDMFYWSGQYFHPNDPNEVGYAGRANDNAASRWRVNLVQDTFGNQMEYLYAEGNRVYYWDGASQLQYLTKAYDASSYLSEIRYNRRSVVGGDEYDRVVLERATRESVVNSQNIGDLSAGVVADANNALFWQTDYLKRIKVLRGNTLVRKYELSYYLLRPDLSYNGSAPPPHVIRLLKDVTQYGADGSSTLPLTSFGYALNEDATHKYGNKHACSNYCPSENEPWYRNHFPYYRLAWVNNGYGGQSEFTYTRDRSDAQNHERPYTYVVQEARTLDGMGHSARQSYSYSGGCWDRPGEACASWDGHHNWTLVGFQNVSESAYDYDDALLATVAHVFRTDSWAFAGREEQTYFRDAGQNLLQQVDQIWASETVSDSTFVYLNQSTSTVWQSGQAQSQRNVYYYSPADQGGVQYGNQTRVDEYDGSNNLYRIQMQEFVPNTSDWIVNKPVWSAVFDSNWDVYAGTFYHYDGHTDWQDGPGDEGKLTLTRARLVQPGASCPKTEQTVDTSYTYDAYGNLETTTGYAGYGQVQCDAGGNWTGSAAGNGSAARTTTTDYDGTYDLYPVQVCSPPVGSPPASHCSSTQYYGVDGVAADYGLPGQVKKVTDPNNVSTEYRYDTFGRVARIKAPDDANWNDGQVTTRFGYSSLGQPGLQRVVTFRGRDTSWEEVFFDGLGRTLQVHQKADGGQEVRTSTAYDGLGRAVETWIPYYGTHGENGGYGAYGYVPPAGGLPSTHTQYDALGRVTQVTQADGTLARMAYDGWRTATLDANGHQKISEVDAFGRLIRVREYSGTYSSPNWNASVYANTIYAYDRLDNLQQVTDAAGNVTTMSYDALGRKLTMSDPDMGAWSYTYNPAGSLQTQSDARGCATTFSYDALERLTGKSYGGGCPGTAAASYSYDQGTNGVGRRTRMDDGSGYTTWSYDVRGRVTQERKIINGAGGGAFVTQWGYDPLDRVTWTKYPGGDGGQVGEQVSYAYNDQGLLDSVTGDDTYVGSTTYDAPGRVELRKLGTDVLRADYVYYPWTTANGLGRLQQLKTGTPSSPTSLQDLRYTYDAVGNVLTIKDYKVAGGTQTQSFGYDALDRLLSANVSGGASGQGQYSHSYAYSGNAGKIGNLTFKTEVGSYAYGAPVSGCSSGTSSTKPHAVKQAGSYTFSYDCNGNITQRNVGSTYDLSYDAENRLASVSGAADASFVYDGDGNRVKATFGDNTTVYVGQHYEQESGQVELDLPDASFESGGQWSDASSSSWPGSAVWRSTWGTASPHSGSYAEALSNQTYGYLQSNEIAVSANTQYDLYTYVRGELDADDSGGNWLIRVYYYDSSSGFISYQNVASGGAGTLDATWQYKGGRFTTPAGTAKLRITLYNYLNSGWVAYDDVSLKRVGNSTNLALNPGFESSGGWNEVKRAEFPGTSIWRGTWGIAGPRSGSCAYAISNLHWGWVTTSQINVPSQCQTVLCTYQVRVYARGEIDPDSSPAKSQGGRWMIRGYWYDSQGNSLGYSNLRAQDSVGGGWTLYSDDFGVPLDAAKFKIGLGSELQSGWIAFDDLRIQYQVPSALSTQPLAIPASGGGGGGPSWVTLYSTGFESGDNSWSSSKSGAFPATSIWNGTWGTGAPRSGSRSVAISNHVYGVIQTDYLDVQPNSTYHLSAWLRGEIDAEESAGKWILRAYYYDANKSALSYTNVDQSSSVSSSWTEQGGDFSTPSNAAYVRVQLYNYHNSGWVAWDDLQLTGPQVTTSYYYAGGQRVAMRKNGVLRWLAGDHLGSTALTAYADGAKGAELRYEAFGETRYAWQDTPTTRRFTGQIEDDTIGLYFYNARYYDAALGRFVQADTIVPEPAAPQSFNRYSYVRNNPLKYVDPSGHVEEWEDEAGGAALGKLKQCFGGTVTKLRRGTWLWRQTLRQQLGPWNSQWELNDYLTREFPQGDFYGRTYQSVVYPTITTAPNANASASAVEEAALQSAEHYEYSANEIWGKEGEGLFGTGPNSRLAGATLDDAFTHPDSVAPQSGAWIEGRYYTQHALERMQPAGFSPGGRGPINPLTVEHAIENAEYSLYQAFSPGGAYSDTRIFVLEGFKVVLNVLGDVVTIMTKGR